MYLCSLVAPSSFNALFALADVIRCSTASNRGVAAVWSTSDWDVLGETLSAGIALQTTGLEINVFLLGTCRLNKAAAGAAHCPSVTDGWCMSLLKPPRKSTNPCNLSKKPNPWRRILQSVWLRVMHADNEITSPVATESVFSKFLPF